MAVARVNFLQLYLNLDIHFQIFSVSTNLWLAQWSDDPDSAVISVRNTYLGVYGALGAGTAISIMSMSLIVAIGGLNASSKLHNNMLMNVLRAPMSFFDTNPTVSYTHLTLPTICSV